MSFWRKSNWVERVEQTSITLVGFKLFSQKNKKNPRKWLFSTFFGIFRNKSLQSTFTLNCALIGALNKYDHESWLWVIDLAAAAFVFHFYLKGIWSRRIFSILKWSQLKLFLLIINEEIFWFVSFFFEFLLAGEMPLRNILISRDKRGVYKWHLSAEM